MLIWTYVLEEKNDKNLKNHNEFFLFIYNDKKLWSRNWKFDLG